MDFISRLFLSTYNSLFWPDTEFRWYTYIRFSSADNRVNLWCYTVNSHCSQSIWSAPNKKTKKQQKRKLLIGVFPLFQIKKKKSINNRCALKFHIKITSKRKHLMLITFHANGIRQPVELRYWLINRFNIILQHHKLVWYALFSQQLGWNWRSF